MKKKVTKKSNKSMPAFMKGKMPKSKSKKDGKDKEKDNDRDDK